MKKIGIVTLASFFLLLFPLTGLSQSGSMDIPHSVGFSVDLMEWFVLEISADSETSTSQGNSMASVSSTVRLENNPVQIRAFVSVVRNQTVELRAQALGDLTDSQGNILPISEIALKSAGEGFCSGSLNKSQPTLIARWVGSGFRQGTVQYCALNGQHPTGDYTQTVIYSLSAI
jgi:hypothetical protein